MARTTKKELDGAFRNFVRQMGAEVAEKVYGEENVGKYILYNEGGWTVRIVDSAGGGQRAPFGYNYFTMSEMYYILHFAASALYEKARIEQEGGTK